MNYLEANYNIIFNEDNFDNSIQALLKHSKNKTRFKKNPFYVSTGGTDTSDYTSKSLRRSNFSQKKFDQTIFNNCGTSGASFSLCEFNNCQFKNANFQESTFSGGIIQNNMDKNPIINSNFNHSLFTNKFKINNVLFQHCVFQGTAFIDCNIENTTFFSSTLEDTLFSSTSMKKVNFSDLNIDYSVFENIHMHQVILPFSQVCFSFGLLPYLLRTSDEIYISSADATIGYIPKDEYLKLIPDFLQYYNGTSDYFPLANIYLALGKNEQAKDAITKGLLFAIVDYDFQRIKYLCKLIYSYPVFSFHERKNIYDYINAHICFSDADSRLQYNYTVYKNEINNYLLNSNIQNTLSSEINIITGINYDNGILLGSTLSIIEESIEYGKSFIGEHSISIRHNSNVEISVFIQDCYQALCVIIPNIYFTLLGIEIIKEKRITNQQKKKELQYSETIKSIDIERAQIQLERDKVALKKEQLELENQLAAPMQQTPEALRQNILNLGVNISEIHHITYGNIPPDVNENIIQHSSR